MQDLESVKTMKWNKTKLLPMTHHWQPSGIANDASSLGKVAVVSVPPLEPTDVSEMETEKFQEDGNEKIIEHKEVATIVASEAAHVMMEYTVILLTPKEKAYKKLVAVVSIMILLDQGMKVSVFDKSYEKQ
jgi:hypothetical protein